MDYNRIYGRIPIGITLDLYDLLALSENIRVYRGFYVVRTLCAEEAHKMRRAIFSIWKPDGFMTDNIKGICCMKYECGTSLDSIVDGMHWAKQNIDCYIKEH